MGYFLLILILIFILWPLMREPVSRWFSGFMARRTEDMMRRMMGMPSRKEEKRQNKKRKERASASQKKTGRDSGKALKPHPAEMMKSVAEDVVFTEIKEFESRTIIESDGENTRIVVEEQITDVEYTEIKK